MAELDAEVRSIFLLLVDRPQDEWTAALAEACAGRPEVRAKVERLLADHVMLGTISQKEDSGQTSDATHDAEAPDSVVAGKYKLLEPLGEGGFGVVYLAEQTVPVRRKVAIKVLKAGMDTKQVVARFDAERQALAIMDHPNIARVFDGGVTPTGRPFFVMEYVKGVPITDFCDQHKLTPSQRLELFVEVCQAVQHAHQKGIIHRDFKPSNVLVLRHDTTPMVKVIDFGVAKALGQELTDKTLFTNIAQMVGTPLYMSPEQAGMSDLDIDTRSDIYSLGVLLYELLTGATPFSKARFKTAGYDEIRRIIREEDPPKPSTRISESTETLPSIAANRGVEPRKLGGLMRGELDWIVMKALEKDRNRRYETANGFAADVRRYLSGEAVLAVPPSAAYRLQKFIRKHRGFLSTAGAIAFLLVAGIAVSTWQAMRATRAESKALAAKSDAEAKEAEANSVVRFFEEKVFSAGRPRGDEGGLGHDVSLREAIQASLPALESSFRDQPLVEARLRVTQGAALSALGEFVEAAEQFDKSRDIFARVLGPNDRYTLACMNNLANTYTSLSRHAEALKLLEETLAAQKRILPPDHPEVLVTMNNLANSYHNLSRHAEALKLREETLATRKRVLSTDHPETLVSLNNLATSHWVLGHHADAMRLFEATLEARKRVLPPDHPDTLRTRHNLANSYRDMHRYADAIKLYEEALATQKRVLPPDHPDMLKTRHNLANTYSATGRHADDLKLREEILAARKRTLPANDPETLSSMHNLANSYHNLNRHPEALKLYEEALAGMKLVFPADHPQTLRTMGSLASTYAALGRNADALKLREETLAACKRVFPADHQELLTSMHNLAITYWDLGRHADAVKLNEETLTARKRVLPADHPETLSSMYNLANKYSDLGRHAEALKLREETLAARKRVLPTDHPETLASQTNLAVSFRRLGREADALPLLEGSFRRKLEVLPANHPFLFVAVMQLSSCYLALDRETDATAAADRYLRHIAAKEQAPSRWIGEMLIPLNRYTADIGDIAGCRATAVMWEKLNRPDAHSLYNAACFRAVASMVQAKSKSPNAAALANTDANKAMDWLRKAVDAGWTDVAHIRKDSDLDSLRSREDFENLLADLEAKALPKSKDVRQHLKGK